MTNSWPAAPTPIASLTSADGTISSITMNIPGTNDAAVIRGRPDPHREQCGTNDRRSMVISDVDSASTFRR
ncbi:MAG: hypothetical protein IPJ25_08625 [Rhodocyclaceae bacterium]|nr:hypothetical protein [Rhodocyclaceae bacterium]